MCMTDQDHLNAFGELDRVLSALENAVAVRLNAPSKADAELVRKHETLRAEVSSALREIDLLIAAQRHG